MPELPEVETIVLDLKGVLIGQTIQSVDIFDQRVIKDLSIKEFKKKLTGQTVSHIYRRAKAVIIQFASRQYLVVQLKMTGQLIYANDLPDTKSNNDAKVVFSLSNGMFLTYNDQRTFGWLIFANDLSEIKYLSKLGPEPFARDFSPQWLGLNLKRHKAPIKTLLMNQEFLAGIGNIYASEILYKARINPLKRACALNEVEIKLLHRSTITILRNSIRHRGTSMRNYRDANGQKGEFINRISVYGRDEQSCSRCRSTIKRIVQAGRSTFFCPACQR